MTTPLNFAPYSDPPPTSSRSTYTPIASTSTYIPPSSSNSYQAGAPVSRLATGNVYSSAPSGGASGLETTLPYDLGLLAAAAYALGPFGAAVLLVLEVESDYARFHAYQSALLCAFLLSFDVLQYLLFGSSLLTWLLIIFEAAILLLLSRRAHRDADLLDRYYLPVIGDLAERWVAEE